MKKAYTPGRFRAYWADQAALPITWPGFRLARRSSFLPPTMTPKALGLAMSMPTISMGWEKEIWRSNVLGSALDTVACEGMSMPKWAKADPDIAKTTANANTVTSLVFIFSSSFPLWVFAAKQKKSHESSAPSWRQIFVAYGFY
jgi:hypothetical protein